MNQQEIISLNQTLISRLGKHQRVDKAIEELIELAHVLTKIKKLPQQCLISNSDMLLEYIPNLLDEMADVTIMLICLMDTLDIKQEVLQEIVENKKNKMAKIVEIKQPAKKKLYAYRTSDGFVGYYDSEKALTGNIRAPELDLDFKDREGDAW